MMIILMILSSRQSLNQANQGSDIWDFMPAISNRFIQPCWDIFPAYAGWRYLENRPRHTALRSRTISGTASREVLQRNFQRCFIAWNVGGNSLDFTVSQSRSRGIDLCGPIGPCGEAKR